MPYGAAAITLYLTDPSLPGANPVGYTITDHSRGPLSIKYENSELSKRMANGQLRRYVVAQKRKISTDWQMVPAAGGKVFTSDGNLGGAWLKNLYEQNFVNPVWLKLTYAEEDYIFGNKQTSTGNNSSNPTFNTTVQNQNIIPTTLAVGTLSVGAFSAGSAVATLTTTNSTYTGASAGQEIYIKGVDQIFNGTWVVDTVSGSTVTYKYNVNNNAPATFAVNSYIQSGTSASFYVDNNDFAVGHSGAVYTIGNTLPVTGVTINGNWTVTGTTGTTLITASWAGTSQSASGRYGVGTIVSSASWTKTLSSLSPATTGPAVSSDIIKTYMTNFTYDIVKRFVLTDYANMSIEFTEV